MSMQGATLYPVYRTCFKEFSISEDSRLTIFPLLHSPKHS
jgi:hypothetical protein